MKAALKGKRVTGNKTVKEPKGMGINESIAKGGVSTEIGYKRLGRPAVITSPKK